MTRPVPRERTRRDIPYVVPSWVDPLVARASTAIGGPVGRHAVIGARGLAGAAAALMMLAALTLALGVWQKGHCLMKGWSSPDHFWRACYSDLPVVYVSSPLAWRELPWSGANPSNQPPLSGLVMWLIARISPTSGADLASQQWVFLLWTLVLLLALLAGVLAVVALQPRRPWQAAHLAASPIVILLALISTDLLGVALVLLALLAWQRGRGWLTGLLLGLALLVRPFPLLILAAIVMVSWRRGASPGDMGRLRALQAVVGTAVGALAVIVPLVAIEPRALTGALDWWRQGAGYGAVQVIPQLLGHPIPSSLSTLLALAGWVAALLVGRALRRRVRTRPHEPPSTAAVIRLAAPMMAVVALTATSLSVQSGLWVLVFLALSARPWREHLLWAAVEALHFLATWLHIAFSSDPGRGLPGSTYALVIVLRAGAWAWMLWQVHSERPTYPEPSDCTEPSASSTSGASSLSTSSRIERT